MINLKNKIKYKDSKLIDQRKVALINFFLVNQMRKII